MTEKLCFKLNSKEAVDYCNKYGEMPPYSKSEVFAHFPYYKTGFASCTTSSSIEKGYTLVTFKEFKERTMKKKEKEIIGYKLVKPEYEEAALAIANKGLHILAGIKKEDLYRIGDYSKYSVSFPNLKDSGVLDLWFEPVYKEEVKEFEFSPTFKVTIKDKKVYHGKEEITDYVNNLITRFLSGAVISNNGSRIFSIEEVTFSKTGCVNEKTTLSQWKELWALIQ